MLRIIWTASYVAIPYEHWVDYFKTSEFKIKISLVETWDARRKFAFFTSNFGVGWNIRLDFLLWAEKDLTDLEFDSDFEENLVSSLLPNNMVKDNT